MYMGIIVYIRLCFVKWVGVSIFFSPYNTYAAVLYLERGVLNRKNILSRCDFNMRVHNMLNFLYVECNKV